jgi:hypothetical protein
MKANDLLQEHLKQIITVASATLVLTVSFIKDVIGSSGTAALYGWLLPVSWITLAASIPCAIISIAILVNHLDKPNSAVGRSGYQKSLAAGATHPTGIDVVFTADLGALSNEAATIDNPSGSPYYSSVVLLQSNPLDVLPHEFGHVSN